MKAPNTSILLIMTFVLTSCYPKNKKYSTVIEKKNAPAPEIVYSMNIDTIKAHIELQLHIEATEDGHPPTYIYTDRDVDIAFPIISQGLKDNGFMELDDSSFRNKVVSIFGDIFQYKNPAIKLHTNFITVLDTTEKSIEDEFDYTVENIFISPKHKCLTWVPLLGDFVEFTDSNHYKIDLHPNIIARNKYLFNNNQPALAQLLHEDTFFLKMLVKSFGYTKEPKINDLVMKDYLDLDDDRRGSVGEIIFVKNAAGVLEIKEELLQWITDHTSINDNKMADALSSYALALYDKSYNTFLKVNAYYFSRDEKRKIAAYIANTYDPLYRRFVVQNPRIWPADGVLNGFLIDDTGMAEYFKQHDYFSLPALKMEMELLNNTTADVSQ
ncbi:MAG: hypothetical protein J7623_11245 [Chitinophaga sp.]|uniref:hypothetical protein n=1 Tax=Chitinophaga sp. TaxID=1869181 RepID=UPI001B0FD967|nr:hypothetical protein [Chitinophaga sp.]MBO9729201.1 hypothetical protein [Chitinophaga sp.]